MADFFKPRRGTQLKAIEALNGENKLRAGELFFELEYEGSTKTVKSGRIMIGDGTSNYADLVTNDRYVFNPDDYMGVTSKFEPTPSTETTITDNRNIINSGNTNIKEKMGAIDGVIELLDENKSNKTHNHTTSDIIDFGSHNHTTADIRDFVASVKAIKVDNASTADYSTNASTAKYATNAKQDNHGNNIYDTYVTNTRLDREIKFNSGVCSTGSLYATHYLNPYDQFTLNADTYSAETFSERAVFVDFIRDIDTYVRIIDMRIYVEGEKKWGNNAIYKLKESIILKAPGKPSITSFTAIMQKEYDIIFTGASALNTIYIRFNKGTMGTWNITGIAAEAGSAPAIANLKVNIHNVKYIYYKAASTDNE